MEGLEDRERRSRISIHAVRLTSQRGDRRIAGAQAYDPMGSHGVNRAPLLLVRRIAGGRGKLATDGPSPACVTGFLVSSRQEGDPPRPGRELPLERGGGRRCRCRIGVAIGGLQAGRGNAGGPL